MYEDSWLYLHYLHIFCNNFHSYNVLCLLELRTEVTWPSPIHTSLQVSKIMWLEFPILKCLHFGLEILVLVVLHISTHGDLESWCCPKSVSHFVENITFFPIFGPGGHEVWLVRSTWLSAVFLFPFSYCKFYNLVFNSISSLEIRHLSLLNFHMMSDILLGICMFCIFYCEYFLFCAAWYMSFLSIYAMSSIKTVAQGN